MTCCCVSYRFWEIVYKSEKCTTALGWYCLATSSIRPWREIMNSEPKIDTGREAATLRSSCLTIAGAFWWCRWTKDYQMPAVKETEWNEPKVGSRHHETRSSGPKPLHHPCTWQVTGRLGRNSMQWKLVFWWDKLNKKECCVSWGFWGFAYKNEKCTRHSGDIVWQHHWFVPKEGWWKVNQKPILKCRQRRRDLVVWL